MSQPYIDQLFKGKVKQLGDPNAEKRINRQWETGMFKKPTDEKIWLSETGLIGDEVADKKNHGGPEKALFAYPTKHYDYWQREIEHTTMEVGGMGENLAIQNADEQSICIGDTYRYGETLIQVSQPRRPCWKPARRYNQIDLALRIQNSGLTGWYFRVLEEGYVTGNTYLELIERPYPQWSIEACNNVMYKQKDDLDLASQLASCELLAPNWKRTLEKRLEGKQSSDVKRVYGPNVRDE